MRRSAWLAFLPVLVVLSAAGCSPDVPPQPAYDVDVAPILNAHCIRCHGAGDMLNVPTEPTGPNAPVPPNIDSTTLQATNIYLQRFENEPAGCNNGDAGCKAGAKTWASVLYDYVRNQKPASIMPPPPAPELDEWAYEILKNWGAESPPICSNSPNPDPSICPSGS